jgi:uncharacterized membrane protein YhaH (DUF805 family)
MNHSDPSAPLPPAPSGQYEFSAADNSVFGGLAGKMRFVGIFLIVVGVLYLFLAGLIAIGAISGQSVTTTQKTDGGVVVTQRNLHIGHTIGYLVGGIIYLCLGVWTGNGAVAFRRIVDTQGSDISHLMEAVTNLRKLYTLQYWLIFIALIVMLVVLVAMVVTMATR